MTHSSVLLLGASRGLGLAIAENYLDRGAHVVATVRGEHRTALHELADRFPGRLEIEHVDITDTDEVEGLYERLTERRFELLFVNAGISHDPADTPATIPTEVFTDVMITNALSPVRTVERLRDLVTADGTIAIMSSGQGSVSNNERGGFEIYRASKSALNQLMRSYAARHRNDPRTVLLLAPGWVRTELGGPGAALTIDESIPRLVSVVEAQRGHGGLRYLDYRGETVAW